MKITTKTPQNSFLQNGLRPVIAGVSYAGQAKIQVKIKIIKFVIGFVILSLVLFNTSFAQAAYSAGTLVSMTNSARAREGLGSLSTNSKLTSAAYAKAQDMFANQYFAHTSPAGKTPWDFIIGSGYSYTYAGENLGIGYTDTSGLFGDWMASSTHRANILNSNFREIGIAVVSGTYEGAETIIAVQEFGATESSNSEPAPQEEAQQNPTPTPATQGETTATPTPSAQTQGKQFQIIRDKSSFNPHSIFSGEEITYSITIEGDIQTLEAQVFDQKINLLETATITGSAKEKTYIMSQKIEKEGNSDVTILAKDKYGNQENLNLGKLEVKSVTLANSNNVQNQNGWFAGFKTTFQNHWIYFVIFGGLGIALAGYFVFRKFRFTKLAKISNYSWEL